MSPEILTYKKAKQLFKMGKRFLKRTKNGHFLYYRGWYANDVKLICKPFVHKTLRRTSIEESIMKKAGYEKKYDPIKRHIFFD